MDYEKLEQLKRLHDSGALNDEEFEKEKKKILDEEAAAKPTAVLPMGLTENAYLALMNFCHVHTIRRLDCPYCILDHG